jgi:phosphate acetyltransferase
MSQGIYVLGAEPRSGESVIVLGLMEMLTGRDRRVGFFKPMIRSSVEQDPVIHLLATRYGLGFPREAMYGCTMEQARPLIEAGRYDEIIKLVLEKYKAVEDQCDVTVCSGTDHSGLLSPLEFDFNVDVANNLGCLVMPIINGLHRSVQEVTAAAGSLLTSLRERKCDLLVLIVTRVSPSLVEEVSREVQRAVAHELPSYVLPEIDLLSKPTVGEIARALNAEVLSGEAGSLLREVEHPKVGAMELRHFLDRIEPGSLIITPGDRADIILGSLLADVSAQYPNISGILLTGDLKPEPQIQRLLAGLPNSAVPIISVATDTFNTTVRVTAMEGTLDPENPKKVAAALGVMESGVDLAAIHGRLSLPRSHRVTPFMFEYELVQRAKKHRQHIVLPEGTEERILRATQVLLLRDVVDVTLLGDQEDVRRSMKALGVSLDRVAVVDPAHSKLRQTFAETYYGLRKQKGISEDHAYDVMGDVSYFGTMMVHLGLADGMVSGAVHTTQHTIRPALEFIRTKPGCSIVSSVFFMCLPDRVLVFGDCAVNPDPDAQQLADIAISSAETARTFGVEPLVAMLSYSTGESGKGKDVEKVREATRIARSQRPDLKIEGPIQYDAAVDENVARTKLPGSDVAGHASVFIFPDLNAGNNTYKAVQRSSNALAVGPVLQGLNKPVNDLSRGCTVADIVNTVAITAIQAQTTQRAT